MLYNQKKIAEYLEYRTKVERRSTVTIQGNGYLLNKLDKELNKKFEDATEQDMLKFLDSYASSSKDTVIGILHKFYRWLFKLYSDDRLPDSVRRLKIQNKMSKQNSGKEIEIRQRIISADEYESMIDKATDVQHKALLETLYVFGTRISELLSMNATDVEDMGDMVRITVRKSKTKPRDVLSDVYPKYLLEWYNTYQPFKNQKDQPLWVSRCNRALNKRLTKTGVLQIVKKLAKDVGIKREITNHDFRHTAISRDLEKGMPVTLVESKYGLVHGSAVIQVYDHNGVRELENYYKTSKKVDRPEPYESIKKQKENLEKKYLNEIKELRDEIDDLKGAIKRHLNLKDDEEFVVVRDDDLYPEENLKKPRRSVQTIP